MTRRLNLRMNRPMSRWLSWRGQFVIQLSLLVAIVGNAKAEIIGIDLGPGKSPVNWNAVSGPGVVANLRDESGEVTNVQLTVANPGTPYSVAPAASTIPKHHNDLSGIDGNGYQFNGAFNATLNGLEPGRLYSIYLFGLRGGAELNQSVTLDGDNRVQFVQSAGDGQLAINDQVGSDSRDLSSYAKQVTASSEGRIAVNVVGGGGRGSLFVVAGLALEPASASADASSSVIQAAATVPAPPIAADADILGVRLDMTLSEARTVLTSADIQIVAEAERDIVTVWGSRLEGLNYQVLLRGQLADGQIDIFGFAPPNEGKIGGIAVNRSVGRMFYADFKELLLDKYGPPVFEYVAKTTRRGELGFLSWSYDRYGKPVTDLAHIQRCTMAGSGVPEKIMYNIVSGSSVHERDYGQCGFTLVYKIGVLNDQPSIMHNFSVWMYDFNEIIAANQETVAYTIEEAEKIRAAELEEISKPRKLAL